jgi:hypothetical protein
MNNVITAIGVSELREWIQLGSIVFGGSVAILTYRTGQRQRRLENSLKLAALLKEELTFDVLGKWDEVFVASSELGGAQRGHFLHQGRQTPFE